MQLTPHQTTASGDTGISFPRLECWNTLAKVATIAAVVNKRRVLCRISLDIMKDKFGAAEDEPMRSVAQHRVAIQEAARKLIENEVYEEDGSVLIRAHNL
ncbi:MAG: DUF1488 domain-containing protein [Candidatus Sedimenticola sp. (ex Thyasira tokunagai)]